MEVNIKIKVFWDMSPCNLAERPNVSEEHAASIFRVQDGEDGGNRFLRKVSTVLSSYTELSRRTEILTDIFL
jgi:hypothetical protein